MPSRWTEESVVALIRETFAHLVAPGARGLIDDGAWLPRLSSESTRVVSCDAFQEGNDFLLHLAPVESAGYRAIVQNLSDLAAMGAKPVGFVWSLEVPRRWLKNKGELLKRFCAGAARACTEYGLSFYGGDLSFSDDRFGCTITIFGDVKATPLSRQGASPGDAIYVSRPLGLSSYGLDILLKKLGTKRGVMTQDQLAEFVEKLTTNERAAVFAHLAPKPEMALAQKLVTQATACMDISDGLARDLHRLCNASSIGAELDDLEAAFHKSLPPAKQRDYAVYGGEEFALLFTAPPKQKIAQGWVRIGSATAESGLVYERRGKQRKMIKSIGYDHFTSRT